jgi:hypothetical protein
MALAIVATLAGCGGSSSPPPPPPPPVPFGSGLYQINGTSNSNPSANFILAGSIMQTGNTTVSGVMHITMASCFLRAMDIPVSGTLTNNSSGLDTGFFTLTLALPSGQLMSFSLSHPGGHLTFVNGTYSVNGSGCAAVDQGSASGRAMAFGGNWTGTLTSSTGTVSNIAMTWQLSGPDAHGVFSATGSATMTGGTCFSAATINPSSTMILGLASTLTMNNSAPGTTGTLVFNGDFSNGGFFAESFSGTYTSTQGACSETGTASMSFS